jgi:hypothetical protein
LAKAANQQNAHGQTRRSFALTGPSVALDPRHNAVRRDLADVRLADRVFAPHYAAPMPRVVASEADLLELPGGDVVLTRLAPGSAFEALEFSGDHAWGIAVDAGLVGYIDATALREIGRELGTGA